LRKRKATLQAQGHEQIEGEKLGDLLRNFQVGFDEARYDAKYEKKNGRVEKIVKHSAIVKIFIDRKKKIISNQ
jgi:hypothetical protein